MGQAPKGRLGTLVLGSGFGRWFSGRLTPPLLPLPRVTATGTHVGQAYRQGRQPLAGSRLRERARPLPGALRHHPVRQATSLRTEFA